MNHGNVSPEIAQGLLELKQRITSANIPPSKIDESLNIATWNIREFGTKKRTEAATLNSTATWIRPRHDPSDGRRRDAAAIN